MRRKRSGPTVRQRIEDRRFADGAACEVVRAIAPLTRSLCPLESKVYAQALNRLSRQITDTPQGDATA